MASHFHNRAEALAIAVCGTALFYFLGLPLPFLFGPMSACLLAALLKRPLKGLGKSAVAARTIIGVAVGASVTPDVIAQLPQMVLSVALMPIYIAVIALVGVPFFQRVCGFDRMTAYYASMPGGLQDMVIFGTESGGDGRVLSLIHATRVLIVVTIAPILIVYGFGAALANPIGTSAAHSSINEVILMILAAIIGWKGGEKIGLFGASILGPMIVTACLSLTGFITQRPPSEAILTAQFLIGLGIGVGYVGVTLQEVRRIVLAGVAFVALLAVLALIFAEIVVQTGLAPPLEAFLAYAPGGQAEMTILAIVSGADLGFVIVHHLSRVFLVITGAPLAARFLMKKRQ